MECPDSDSMRTFSSTPSKIQKGNLDIIFLHQITISCPLKKRAVPIFLFDTTYKHICFRTLVKRANTWLRSNPDVELKTLETITWTATTMVQMNETDAVYRSKSLTASLKTRYLRGLRYVITLSLFKEHDKMWCTG